MASGREDAESKLVDVIERQAGYFTASPAIDEGYRRTSQSYPKKAANWLSSGRGVYRLAHSPVQVDVHEGGRRG